jgi:MFS family permease
MYRAIPRRYLVLVGTLLLTMLLFADRIALSAAKGSIVGQFGLSDEQFGWALAIFSLGYASCQVPGGALADRYGPRRFLTATVILWSVFTLLSGLAWGLASLLVFRLFFGVAEAGAMPALSRVVYNWLPDHERALAQGINLSGTRLGGALALPFVAWLITAFGWRAMFFVLSVVGVSWAIAWYICFRDTPEQHPAVDPAEAAPIMAEHSEPGENGPSDSGTKLFNQPQIYLLMVQYFASNFTFVFFLTWLFPHLQETYKLSIMGTGLLSAMPLLGGTVANWIGGAAVDLLYRKGFRAASRWSLAVIGFALATIGLVGSLTADSAVSAVLWLTLAIFGTDLTHPPSWAMCIDMGGRRSGLVSGIMNMAGNIGAFSTALAFPYLLSLSGSTTPFFLVAAALNIVAMIMWLLMPMADRVRRARMVPAQSRGV